MTAVRYSIQQSLGWVNITVFGVKNLKKQIWNYLFNQKNLEMAFYQLFHLILHEIDRFGCFMLKSGFFFQKAWYFA